MSVATYIRGSAQIATVDEALTRRMQLLRLLKENLGKAQQRMTSMANQHRLDRQFQVGDWVMLKLQPYRQTTVKGHAPPKLNRRFVGPFCVLSRIGSVAYELVLPPEAKIHPVFHVSKLRPFHGKPPSDPVTLPSSVTSTTVSLEPDQILGSRTLLTTTGTLQKLLVKWKGFVEEEATWEDLCELRRTWPLVKLEDKFVLKEGVMLRTRL